MLNYKLKVKPKERRSIVVYIMFAITSHAGCLTGDGVNSNVVAMIPVAVFCIAGVITDAIKEISWSVLDSNRQLRSGVGTRETGCKLM